MSVKPIPDGYHTITPYLMVENVDRLLKFLKNAFAAEELLRLKRPDGSVMHAEAQIGDSRIMMGEPMEDFGPMPASIYLYVENCDAIYEKALKAGGKSIMPPMDMAHAGERYGGVRDGSGNIWWIATHIEDLTPEEAARRIEEMKDNWD